MDKYTYKFTWKENGKVITKYLDAPSAEDAKKDFEKTFKIKPDRKYVHVSRQTGNGTFKELS